MFFVNSLGQEKTLSRLRSPRALFYKPWPEKREREVSLRSKVTIFLPRKDAPSSNEGCEEDGARDSLSQVRRPAR
jgi:hypothetical protein